MKYGSVCSGIEAATVAWSPLGWSPAWFSEIEPFPSAVLAHHYPDTPNLGDMTAIADKVTIGEVEAPDILVGGTPCQSFSVAGLRGGLSDDRGSLTISYVELANAIDNVREKRGNEPSIIVWENVPGVLSSKDNAFGCFLGALSGEDRPLEPPRKKWANAGYVHGPQRRIAWRVLDAQYFGVPQQRRRVFVVASSRKGFCPAAVLFEKQLSVDDKRRPAGEDAVLRATNDLRNHYNERSKSGTLQLHSEWRYLTPVECERATGFPDNYTNIKFGKPKDYERRGQYSLPVHDQRRYKALGNSMAVPVVRWIGERIDFMETYDFLYAEG